MIPNVFISSTIADLHFLRDTIRSVVFELGYNPIMSEYGDIGYLSSVPVPEACYNAMRDSQIVILIVAKRYGQVESNGIGITHNEFRVAREKRIPVLCLIEKEVMSFKKVFDRNDDKDQVFPEMDNHTKTFELINEFASSHVNNGYTLFETVNEARQNVVRQLAHFFGELLINQKEPIKSDIKDILSEVKALRNELIKEGDKNEYDRYQKISRALIDDYYIAMFNLLKKMFKGNIDHGIQYILKSESFVDFIRAANWTYQIESVPDFMRQELVPEGYSSMPDGLASKISFEEHPSQIISFVVEKDKSMIRLNDLTFKYLGRLYSTMKAEVEVFVGK